MDSDKYYKFEYIYSYAQHTKHSESEKSETRKKTFVFMLK